MTADSHFVLQVLRDLQSRTEAAAKRHPGLRHMLVLPPGERISVPSPFGVRPLGAFSRKQRLATCRFGETELVGPLPPRKSWPKGIEPLRAVVAGQHAEEPYRIHLFFGGTATAFKRLQALANDLDGIQPDVTRALFGDHSISAGSVFFSSNDCLSSVNTARLDSWLCTVHWWVWAWTEGPFRTKPEVVHAGNTYKIDPRDDAVKSKLAFSMFDADILTASATTLSLILRFFDEPPAPFKFADYPYTPKSEEMRPENVAAWSERFIRYVTTYLDIKEEGERQNEAATRIRR